MLASSSCCRRSAPELRLVAVAAPAAALRATRGRRSYCRARGRPTVCSRGPTPLPCRGGRPRRCRRSVLRGRPCSGSSPRRMPSRLPQHPRLGHAPPCMQPCAAIALPLPHPKLTAPLLLLMVNVFMLLHNKNLQWRNFKQKILPQNTTEQDEI